MSLIEDDARANALRKRGRGDVTTSDRKKFLVQVIQSKCMGAESCVGVAPGVFSLDSKKLRPFGEREELGVHAANISDYPSQVLFSRSPVKMMF